MNRRSTWNIKIFVLCLEKKKFAAFRRPRPDSELPVFFVVVGVRFSFAAEVLVVFVVVVHVVVVVVVEVVHVDVVLE